MVGKVIMCGSFLMCSFPFLIISLCNKENEITPIVFWAGSESELKNQVKDIKGYNREMAALYMKCAIAFICGGVGALVYPMIGIVILVFNCTLGIYLVFRNYKRILLKYSSVSKNEH